jgi:hypothetical protein
MTTNALIDKYGINFPIGYGPTPTQSQIAPARSSASIRCIWNPPDSSSTPKGQVLTSVYSSLAIGRLVPDDVVGFIRYMRERTS